MELGFKVRFIYLLVCAISSLLLFSFYERLEFLADAPLLDLHTLLPHSLLKISLLFNEHSQHLIIASFVLHATAMKLSPARTIFTELMSLISWPALFAFNSLHFKSPDDGFLCKVLGGGFIFVLSSAILVSPRKPKHTRRPNNIISSAFSVASTPNSQCSSLPSTSYSAYTKVASPYRNIRPRFGQNRFASQWIDDDLDSPMDMSPSATFNDALPDPTREGSKPRECTPFTEISGRLNLISLAVEKENESPKRIGFNPPKSQAPRMLSLSAITPAHQRIRRSPFPSLARQSEISGLLPFSLQKPQPRKFGSPRPL